MENNKSQNIGSLQYVHRTSEFGFSAFILKENYNVQEFVTTDQDINGVIYKMTNRINKKFYIGLTKRGLDKRTNYHIQKASEYKRNKQAKNVLIVDKAIAKYGIDNFDVEILEDNIKTLVELNDAEVFWIKWYDATNLKIAYNVSEGGHAAMSAEIRAKISKANKGLFVGEKSAWWGKKHTEETKQKMSDSGKGRIVSTETKAKNSEQSIRTSLQASLKSAYKQRVLSKEQELEIIKLFLTGNFKISELCNQLGITKSIINRVLYGTYIYDKVSIEELKEANVFDPIDLEIRKLREQIPSIYTKSDKILNLDEITKELKLQILTEIIGGNAIKETTIKYGIKYKTMLAILEGTLFYSEAGDKEPIDCLIENAICEINKVRSHTRITKQEELQIVEDYKIMRCLKDVANKYDRHEQSIKAIVKRHLGKAFKNHVQYDESSSIYSDYKNGINKRQLSLKYKHSEAFIRKIIKEFEDKESNNA